ncbi:MAG TPA: hypothetical protein VMP38_04140 [Candidatus Acidoferrum sp.]|nr:hypothetical protein [Candidatus Acidoferrum sp.]
MIDQTSNRIEEHQAAIGRANRRRYAFHRLLQATDRLLWHLEEMNRDGVKVVSRPVRRELRELGEILPQQARESLHDKGDVQDALDCLFDVQEQLFRWRFPGWHDWDPDSEAETVAS